MTEKAGGQIDTVPKTERLGPEVLERGPDRVFQSMVWAEVQRTDQGLSLPDKVQRLLQLCKPERDWGLTEVMDDVELRRIDGLRHEIMHTKFGTGVIPLQDCNAQLTFIERTGFNLFKIVQLRYFAGVELPDC